MTRNDIMRRLLKAPMCFLLFFRIYYRTYKRKQAYPSILWNDLENKHIGNCGKISLKLAIFIIMIIR